MINYHSKALPSPTLKQSAHANPKDSRTTSQKVLLVWAIIRLPALILTLYLMRNTVILKLDQLFGIVRPTLYIIDLLSTSLVRIIYCLTITVVLSLYVGTTRRHGPVTAYFCTLGLTLVLILLSFYLTSTPMWFGLPAVIIAATNLLPAAFITPMSRCKHFWNPFMALGVGFAEVLFLRQYIDFLVSRHDPADETRWFSSSLVPTVASLFLTAVAAAAMLGATVLIPLEQAMRMPREVRILARGNFNWLEIDATGRYLYASGYGITHLRRYNLADWFSPPLKSDVPTGGAQGFAYDAAASELYFLNSDINRLIYLDATTLKFKRSIHVSDMSPGDVWVVVEKNSDTITIASEVDQRTGTPLLVLNRTTGVTLDRRAEEVGNLLVHPNKPILYFSSFRRDTGIKVYDILQHAITRQASTKERVDRMAIWMPANELLIASPLESQIKRFDTDTLEPKGEMDSIFGVRVIAVDNIRNLLLCGSLATGKVAVIELDSGKQRGSYYLGPWLRTIVLSAENGIAYVSSNGALYEVNYGGRK